MGCDCCFEPVLPDYEYIVIRRHRNDGVVLWSKGSGTPWNNDGAATAYRFVTSIDGSRVFCLMSQGVASTSKFVCYDIDTGAIIFDTYQSPFLASHLRAVLYPTSYGFFCIGADISTGEPRIQKWSNTGVLIADQIITLPAHTSYSFVVRNEGEIWFDLDGTQLALFDTVSMGITVTASKTAIVTGAYFSSGFIPGFQPGQLKFHVDRFGLVVDAIGGMHLVSNSVSNVTQVASGAENGRPMGGITKIALVSDGTTISWSFNSLDVTTHALMDGVNDADGESNKWIENVAIAAANVTIYQTEDSGAFFFNSQPVGSGNMRSSVALKFVNVINYRTSIGSLTVNDRYALANRITHTINNNVFAIGGPVAYQDNTFGGGLTELAPGDIDAALTPLGFVNTAQQGYGATTTDPLTGWTDANISMNNRPSWDDDTLVFENLMVHGAYVGDGYVGDRKGALFLSWGAGSIPPSPLNWTVRQIQRNGNPVDQAISLEPVNWHDVYNGDVEEYVSQDPSVWPFWAAGINGEMDGITFSATGDYYTTFGLINEYALDVTEANTWGGITDANDSYTQPVRITLIGYAGYLTRPPATTNTAWLPGGGLFVTSISRFVGGSSVTHYSVSVIDALVPGDNTAVEITGWESYADNVPGILNGDDGGKIVTTAISGNDNYIHQFDTITKTFEWAVRWAPPGLKDYGYPKFASYCGQNKLIVCGDLVAINNNTSPLN